MESRSERGGLVVALILEDVVHQYGLEAMLRAMDQVAEVHRFTALAELTALADGPDVDLVVLASGDREAGWSHESTTALRACGVRLLVLVSGTDDADIARAAELCGHGFVDRDDLAVQALQEAVLAVTAGRELYVSSTLARTLMMRAGRVQPPMPVRAGINLTPREMQVLECLAQGLSNKQVARRLAISEHGVKRLVGNVLAKFNCPNRTLAVVRAMEAGLLAAA